VTFDRPDDVAGPQVHVLYVVAADVADRGLDTDGEIAASVASWQGWLRAQTGGRGIRLDTYQGALDVTFFRLATTSDAALPRPVVAISTELAAAGFSAPDKIYAVYYDGASTLACGDGGGPYPSEYLTGSDSRSGTRCMGSFGVSPPGYFDFALLHELVHSLGYVPSCAPHAASQHVTDSPYDLMWGGGSPWASLPDMQLDVGHDDYFEAHIPDCPDLSGSRFLEGGGARLGVTVTHREGAGGSVDVSLPERRLLTCTGDCPVYLDSWPVTTLTLTARLDTIADEFRRLERRVPGRRRHVHGAARSVEGRRGDLRCATAGPAPRRHSRVREGGERSCRNLVPEPLCSVVRIRDTRLAASDAEPGMALRRLEQPGDVLEA
jgi:hypothetical protein